MDFHEFSWLWLRVFSHILRARYGSLTKEQRYAASERFRLPQQKARNLEGLFWAGFFWWESPPQKRRPYSGGGTLRFPINILPSEFDWYVRITRKCHTIFREGFPWVMSGNANPKNSPKFVPWSKLFIVWASSFYWQSLRWQKSKCCRRSPEKKPWRMSVGIWTSTQSYKFALKGSFSRPKTIPLSWNHNYKTRCRYSYLIPSYSQLFSPLTHPVAFFARLAAGSATTLSSLGTK